MRLSILSLTVKTPTRLLKECGRAQKKTPAHVVHGGRGDPPYWDTSGSKWRGRLRPRTHLVIGTYGTGTPIVGSGSV